MGRENAFDFLRFFLASLVILSHSFALLYSGWSAYDPLLHWTRGQAALGGVAVDGFFLISGFLITKSWEHSQGVADYAKKRALRILPALVLVLLVTVFVFGPLATDLRPASYFHSPRTWAYFGMMGTKNLHLTDTLPGVFTHNPLANRVNGSLWTIRCEAICYILVAALGLLRVYRRPIALPLVSAAALAVMALNAHKLSTLGEWADSFRVLLYFLWGMTFYLCRDFIPFSRGWLMLSLGGILVSEVVDILPYTLPLLGAYALFYAAFRPAFGLQRFARRGDFSYGLYLYAFPVQQLLVTTFQHSLNAGALTLAAFLLALACAVLSWHLVEKPALHRKRAPLRPIPSEETLGKAPEPALAGQTT